MALELQERVYSLEDTLNNFIVNVGNSILQMNKSNQEFKAEMREFKSEMREFKAEMQVYKEETAKRIAESEKERREFKAEMQVYREETAKRIAESEKNIQAYSDKMAKHVEESRKEMREFRKELGGISNKMGMLVEDLIAPAIRLLIQRYFGEELVDVSTRRKRKQKKIQLEGEFDIIAVSEQKVYVVSVKSNPSKKYIDEIAIDITERFKLLFPEYSHLESIFMLGSLSVEKEIVDYATSQQVYVLAYREWDYMDLLNFDELKKS